MLVYWRINHIEAIEYPMVFPRRNLEDPDPGHWDQSVSLVVSARNSLSVR